jgi:hypothetical protein
MNWHTVLFGVALYGAWVIAGEEAEISRDEWEHTR